MPLHFQCDICKLFFTWIFEGRKRGVCETCCDRFSDEGGEDA